MQNEERDAIRQYIKMKKNEQEYNMGEVIEELYQQVLEESKSEKKETEHTEER